MNNSKKEVASNMTETSGIQQEWNKGESETYVVMAFCSNCGHTQRLICRKGHKTHEYTRDLDCENCGCRTLR